MTRHPRLWAWNCSLMSWPIAHRCWTHDCGCGIVILPWTLTGWPMGLHTRMLGWEQTINGADDAIDMSKLRFYCLGLEKLKSGIIEVDMVSTVYGV
jgi:hypothetical protein